ncbi:PepSY domain-containing protein [Thalassobacillus hwangdonensis]|uniref:PepSY domain-containing protein n=1 Tax=Thalassobacillus hwangdonensis TaxID=546108 RepID=A0ABW3L3N3_9BACI
MKITKKMIIIGAVTLGIAGGSLLLAETDQVEDVFASSDNQNQSQLIEEAKLSESEAEKVATDKVSGEVVATEVEKDDGTIVYEFDIRTETGVTEVEVDGNTGKVLDVEQDDEDDENDDDGKEDQDDKNENEDKQK